MVRAVPTAIYSAEFNKFAFVVRPCPNRGTTTKVLTWFQTVRHTMDCKTCDDLFSFYKHSVSRLRNAVLEDESKLAADEPDRLKLKCKDACDALMAHMRKDHSNVNEKLGSS